MTAFAVIFHTTLAQSDDCNLVNSEPVFLDGNFISAPLGPEPANYMTTRDFQFLVQEDDQARQTITAQSLWMAGRDPSGNLQTSFVTYPGGNPVFIGPLNEDGSVYSDCLNDFYRVWNVRRAQIEFHISDFSDNGQIDNPIEDVIGWPGEGNDHFFDIYGFELPNSTQLAPFLDLDSDGIYEPLDGEYPVEPVDQSIPQYLSWEVHNTLLTDPIFSQICPLS
ncbi:MAG: hypothetical protein AAFY91_18940 [Bacteroidota bacterium]